MSGPRGPPGICSCNLTTLFAPGNIPELLPGPPGNPGIDGKMGLTGLPVSVHNCSLLIMALAGMTHIVTDLNIVLRATSSNYMFIHTTGKDVLIFT